MKIGAVLPHLLKFGGVRRFIEVGNEFVSRGHDYTVYTDHRHACRPDWIDFTGRIDVWTDVEDEPDVVMIGDPPSFKRLDRFTCPKYVWVIAGGEYRPAYRKMYESGKARMMVNSRVFLQDYPDAALIEGGVNTEHFKCGRLIRLVGYYKGRGRLKGEEVIERALEGLEGVTLVPFRDLDNDGVVDLFNRINYFVTWEHRQGWCNMAAEAIASGVTVVTNGVNCEPFLDRCIVVKDERDLRNFFEDPMAEFSWGGVVRRLIKLWMEDGIWKD